MFNVGQKYHISPICQKPTVVVVEEQHLLPEPPPPPPRQKVKGKGLDELIDKIKNVNIRQNKNKKITF
jgi:hypothetical protein